MDNVKPEVSVIMTCYNAEKYISECIVSILQQTFKNFEFIIVDDCSTDNTPTILQHYTEQDKRIRLIKTPYRIGFIPSLNMGAKLAKGKYIARIDADDISLEKRIELEKSFLDQNPDYGLVGTKTAWVNENGKIVFLDGIYENYEKIKNALLYTCPFAHSSVMYRKDVFIRLGGYNEALPYGEDYEMWVKMSSITKVKNLPQLLTICRWHKNQTFRHKKILLRQYTKLKIQLLAWKMIKYPLRKSTYILFPYLATKIMSQISKLRYKNDMKKLEKHMIDYMKKFDKENIKYKR